MARVAVLGEAVRIQGYGLVGALACPADSPDDVRRAFAALPDDVALVLLTPAGAAALGTRVHDPRRLTVVLP